MARKLTKDSILVTAPDELMAVGEVFRNEYRELEWRKFLPVKSDLPDWAKEWQVTKINGLAPAPKLKNELAPNEMPQASIQRTKTTFALYEYMLGYGYTDSEALYANHVGVNLEAERALAIGRSFEEFFELLAATGDAYGDMTTGLINQATGGSDANLVTELPKAAGSGNTGWFDLSSGLPTATALEMALDLVHMCNTVERVTLNRNKVTDIVLADALYDVAGITVQGNESTRTALNIFRELRPGVAINRWYKLDAAGASGRHRIMAYDARDPHGPRMVTPQEPTTLAPWRAPIGWQVPVEAKTGGVVVYKKQTMAYLDPVNQA
jgi:hypothetical protein